MDTSKQLDVRGKENSEADSDCEVHSKLGPGGDLKLSRGVTLVDLALHSI